ncbi:MAG: PAS domain S-box protein [Cyanobacteria bacterium J06592_8]
MNFDPATQNQRTIGSSSSGLGLMQHCLEQFPTPIALLDDQMRYILVSQRWRQALGLGEVSLVGCAVVETLPILDKSWNEIQQGCLTGQPQTWEIRVTDRESESELWQGQAQPWYGESKNVEGILLSLEEKVREQSPDPTPNLTQVQRDRSESTHQHPENFQQLHNLANNVPGVLYQFQLSADGTPSFPYISSGCRELYGIEAEVAQQNPNLLFVDFVHPDDLEELRRTITQSRTTLKQWKYRWRIINTNGQEKWLKGIALPKSKADGSILWDGCIIDITEQKEIQKQLQASQKFLELVLDNIPQLIFWKDRNSVFLGCNQNCAEVAGLNSPAEIVGKTDFDLPWKREETEWFREWDRRVMESDQAELHIVEPIQKANGKQAWLETNKIPLHDLEGNVIGILGTVEDITERKQVEETLRTLNQTLEQRVSARTAALERSLRNISDIRLALDQAAIVYTTDTQGKIIFVNEKFCDLSKYTQAELMGKTPRIVNSGYHSSAFFRQMWQTISQGKIWRGEIKNKAKDGSEYWVETTIAPFLDEHRKPYQYIAISYDLSDRKQAELALIDTNNKLQALIANLPGAVYHCCNDTDWKMVYLSDEIENISGYSSSDFINNNVRSYASIIYTEDRDRVNQVVSMALDQKEAFALEYRIVCADGTVKWVYERGQGLLNEAGELVNLNGVIMDINDRRQAEQQLQEQKAFLQSIWDGVDYGIYVLEVVNKGEDFRFARFNLALRNQSPIQVEQLLNRTISETFPDETAQLYLSRYRRCVESGESIYFEEQLTVDSETKWWQLNVNPLRDQNDQIHQLIVTTSDISDRKLAQHQLQESEARLRQLFEGSADAILILDNGRFTDCNQATLQMLRADSKAEFLALHPSRLSPEYQPDGRLSFEKIHAMIAITKQRGSHRFEWVHRRMDGEEFWVEVSLTVIPLGDRQVLHTVWREIGDRIAAEQSIRQHTARLQEQNQALMELTKHPALNQGDLNLAFPVITEAVAATLGVERASIWFYDAEKTSIQSQDLYIRSVNEHQSNLQLNAEDYPAYFAALALDQIIVASDAKTDSRTAEFSPNYLQPLNIVSMLDSPIRFGGETVGVLCLEQVGTQREWYLEDENFVRSIADLISLCLEARDRRQAQAELQQKEEQYRSIFEAVSDAILINDLETGKLIEANPAAYQMHGYTREEFLKLSPTTYIHPDSLPIFAEYLEVIKDGKKYTCEAANLHKNGRAIEIEVSGSGFNYNGKPHALGMVRDITERKQAEIRLQKLTQNLTEAQRIAHIGNWNYNGESDKLTWSDEVFRILDRPWDAEIPDIMDWTNCFYSQDAEALQQALNQTYVSQEPSELELRIGESEATWRYVHLKIEAVSNVRGEVIGLFGTIMDISDRKQAELQLQQQATALQETLDELQSTQAKMVQSEKMSSLGQMVAGVAHEINNPVSFIHANLPHASRYVEDLLELIELYQEYYPEPDSEIQEMIAEIELDFLKEDFTKLVQSMKVGTERIREIVLSLRNFSRLDEAELKSANLHQGIDSTLMILSNRLKAQPNRPEIKVIQNYGKLPFVHCCAGPLNQVFMNILSNAIDALEETLNVKEIDPQIQITTQVIHKNWVRICIADNGKGMPDSVKAKLFDPFFTTKPVGKGTGLGLSISYQVIVDKHHGKLECNSTLNQGTEFIIELPIQSQL